MGVESVHNQERVPVRPPVYELIEQGAGCDSIIQQMYADYFATRDNERVLLGLRNLQSRDMEGAAYIRMMSHGNDELSQLIKEVQDKRISGQELEEVFGIKRYGAKIGEPFDPEVISREYYAHAVKLGFAGTEQNLSEVLKQEQDEFTAKAMLGISTENHGEKMLNLDAMFGVDEPSYLELLGPEEILRLRSMEQPSMLLLGSLGTPSAKHFYKFGNKINPNTATTILEIDPEMVDLMNKDTDSKNNVVEGDAREMPFADESMEGIYTNSLFHQVVGPGNERIDRIEAIGSIFLEAFRVLKKGGSFVINEQPYSRHKRGGDFSLMVSELVRIASRVGFSSKIIQEKNLTFPFSADISSPIIDENGFPHYENSLIIESSNSHACIRFVK